MGSFLPSDGLSAPCAFPAYMDTAPRSCAWGQHRVGAMGTQTCPEGLCSASAVLKASSSGPASRAFEEARSCHFGDIPSSSRMCCPLPLPAVPFHTHPYVRTHKHMHKHTHIRVRTRTSTHIRVCTRTNTHKHTHIRVCTCTNTHTSTHIRTSTHTSMCAHTQAHTGVLCTRTSTHTHKRTHTCTSTHMFSCTHACDPCMCTSAGPVSALGCHLLWGLPLPTLLALTLLAPSGLVSPRFPRTGW